MSKFVYKVVGAIYLAEGETAELMRQSNGRPLSCDFGAGFVRLKQAASAWAIPILVEMRGLDADPMMGLLIWGASEE